MKELLELLPENLWIGNLIIVLGFASLAYIVYFYFSKNGKDERGRNILTKTCLHTLIVVILIANLLVNDMNLLYINEYSAPFLWQLLLTLMLVSQVLFIVFYYYISPKIPFFHKKNTLYNSLKDDREKIDMTAKDVAIKASQLSKVKYKSNKIVIKRTIECVESGNYRPSTELAILISEALNRNVSDVFTYIDR